MKIHVNEHLLLSGRDLTGPTTLTLHCYSDSERHIQNTGRRPAGDLFEGQCVTREKMTLGGQHHADAYSAHEERMKDAYSRVMRGALVSSVFVASVGAGCIAGALSVHVIVGTAVAIAFLVGFGLYVAKQDQIVSDAKRDYRTANSARHLCHGYERMLHEPKATGHQDASSLVVRMALRGVVRNQTDARLDPIIREYADLYNATFGSQS